MKKFNLKASQALADIDQVLLQLIQQRDEAALTMLYDRHCKLVYSLVLSIVGNISDAEEVTQEVFLKVWGKAQTYDLLRGSVLAWLTTITRRHAIDRTRSKLYKNKSREVLLDAANQSETTGTPSLTDGETNEIRGALNLLESKHREVIILSYFQGLSHSEIAQLLSTPLGTVKTRIRDAIFQLREMLKVKLQEKHGT